MAAVVRVTIILVSLLCQCPRARTQTTGELCDLDLWYMDMAAEGAFDGELSEQQRTVKLRIEALIARHRQRADGGRISCSTLSTFQNILLHGRTNSQVRHPADPDTDKRHNDRDPHAHEGAPSLNLTSERKGRVDRSEPPSQGVKKEKRNSKQKQRKNKSIPVWTCQNINQSECSVYEFLFPTSKSPPSNKTRRMKSVNSYFWRLCICLRQAKDRRKYPGRNFSFCQYHLLMRGLARNLSQVRLNETKAKPQQDTKSGQKSPNFWLLCACPRPGKDKWHYASGDSSFCQYYMLAQGISENMSERRSNVTRTKPKQISSTPPASCDRPGVCSYLCFLFFAPHKCFLLYLHNDVRAPKTVEVSGEHQTQTFEKEESKIITTVSVTATSKDDLSSSNNLSLNVSLVSSSDVTSKGKESSAGRHIPDVTLKDTLSPGAESPKGVITSGDTGVSLTVVSSDDSDKSNHTTMSSAKLATTGGIKTSNNSGGVNTSFRIIPFLMRTESGHTDCVANNLYVFRLWQAIKRKASGRSRNQGERRGIKRVTKSSVPKGDGASNSNSSPKPEDNELTEKTETSSRKEKFTGHKPPNSVTINNVASDPLPREGNLNQKINVHQDFVKPEDKGKPYQDENSESVRNKENEQNRSEVLRLEQLLRQQSLLQTSKIQSLEMMVMKLGKQQMSQTMDEQRELTRLLRLENQILQLENELLRLNQSHAHLHEENEKLKARQSQYPALEHKPGQKGRWAGRSDLVTNSGESAHFQIVSAQQKKVDRLDKLLKIQGGALDRLQSQLQKLEGRNNALEGMMANQASILSHAMMKLQGLIEENLKSRREVRETGSMVDLPVSSLQILEKIENILQTKLYVGNGGQVSPLTSVQERVVTQSRIQSIGHELKDVLKSLPLRSITGADSGQIKCDLSRSQKVCLYYVLVISQCPPFRTVSWGKCPHLAGEFLSGGIQIMSTNSDSGSEDGDAFHRVSSANSNAGTRVTDTIRKFTPDTREGLSTTYTAHANDGVAGTRKAPVSLGGHAGTSWGANDNDEVRTDSGKSVEKTRGGEKGRDSVAGDVSGPKLEKPDLPPTTSVQKTHIPNEGTDSKTSLKDITPDRVAEHAKNRIAQGGDIVDIPEIHAPAESGRSPGDPEHSASSHDRQSHHKVMPEPVSVSDLAVQQEVDTDTKEDADSAETSEGQPSHSKPNSLSSKMSHTATVDTPSAYLDTVTANQDTARTGRTGHFSDKTDKDSEDKGRGELRLQDSVSMATERAAEETKKTAEQQLEAELMAKKLGAAERRAVLYPPLGDRRPKDCYDILLKSGGQARNGPHKVFVAGLRLYVTVYCDMKAGGWTVLLKREDGSVNFYREWQEYKEGFGGPFSEHYVGNDVVHHITNQGHYSLQVELKDWEGETRDAKYKHFWVEGEDQGFRLHVVGYSGTAGDGLSKHDGMKFSTKDVDNDLLVKEMGGSCARRFQGAGWYYKCYASNLFGQHYLDGVVPDKRFDGVAWKPWKGPSYSLKEVAMKIRPSDVP